MNQTINNTNLLALAWSIVRPYILEAPALLNEEFDWLGKTAHIANTLTSPELLFEYLSLISPGPETPGKPRQGDLPDAVICRTNMFKQLPADQRMPELIDVTNILSCFRNIFSTREKQIKNEYRDLLEASFYDYKIVKFYYITTHDLIFESFHDLVKYFDILCNGFSFDIVISKSMAEYFCQVMTSVVSRFYKLKHILTPSYAYYGLLPVYAAAMEARGSVHLMMSITVSRCFVSIPQDHFYEDETPALFNYILKRLIESLSGSILGYMSPDSIFNSDITGAGVCRPAKNTFTLTKSFTLGANKVQIFSYNNTLEDFLAVIAMGGNPAKYIYITEGLRENNTAPLSLCLLSMFAVNTDMNARKLSENEEAALDALAKDLRFLFQ